MYDPYAKEIMGAADTIMKGVSNMRKINEFKQQERDRQELDQGLEYFSQAGLNPDSWQKPEDMSSLNYARAQKVYLGLQADRGKLEDLNTQKKVEKYANDFLPTLEKDPASLNSLDLSEYGSDALYALQGVTEAGKAFRNREDVQKSIWQSRMETAAHEYEELNAKRNLANQWYDAGEVQQSAQVVADILNQSNNPYSAEPNEDGTLKVKFQDQGEDTHVTTDKMSVEEALQELNRWGAKEYTQFHLANMEDATQKNYERAANPDIWTDGQNQYRVIKLVHPQNNNAVEFKVFNNDGSLAFNSETGRPYSSFEELMNQGFQKAKSMEQRKAEAELTTEQADALSKQALAAKRFREAETQGQQDWEKITDRDGKMYWIKPGTNERIELGVDGSPSGKDQPAILQETDALFQNILQSQGLNDADLDEGERAELWLDAHTKASSKGQSDPREAGATFYKGIFNRLLQYGEEPQSAEKVAQEMTDKFLETYYNYKPPMSDARKREIKDHMKKHLQKGDIPVSKLRKRALDLGLSEKDLQEMGLTVGGQSRSQGQSSQGAGQDAYSDLRIPNPTTDWRTYADMPPMNPPAGGNRQ